MFILCFLEHKADGDDVLLLLWCLMMREMRVCKEGKHGRVKKSRIRGRDKELEKSEKKEKGKGTGGQIRRWAPWAHQLRPKNQF